MRYTIKEKNWTLTERFHISDVEGNPLYEVKGKAFSFRNAMDILNERGEVVAQIFKRRMALHSTYEIQRPYQETATMKHHFGFFKVRFTLSEPQKFPVEVKGHLFKFNYTFTRGERTIATVAKTKWSWADTYGIEIAETEDDLLILCAVVVLDRTIHNGKR